MNGGSCFPVATDASNEGEQRQPLERDSWHQGWQRDRIGFHRSDIDWALARHWNEISPDGDAGLPVRMLQKSVLADRSVLLCASAWPLRLPAAD